MRLHSWKINKFKSYTHWLQLDPTTHILSDQHLQWPGQARCIWCPAKKKKTRLVCLRVQLKMMTRDLFALKMAWKIGNPHKVAWLRVSQPIRRENDDVIERKMRLDDIIMGIKGLVTVFFLIPSPAIKEATSLGKNPHNMALANRHITLFSHRQHSDGTYELPDYSHEDHNEM